MQVEDARKIIAVMMVSYPNFKPVDVDFMAQEWANMLSEYTYQQVDVALRYYITTDTSGFAPSIGKIVEKIKAVSEPKELNEIEAWTLVSKALRNGYYGAEEEFAKLPPIVQKAVGSPEQIRMWATTDEKSVETVIASNFMRAYKIELRRAEEFAKLPESTKNLLGKLSPLKKLEQKEE